MLIINTYTYIFLILFVFTAIRTTNICIVKSKNTQIVLRHFYNH